MGCLGRNDDGIAPALDGLPKDFLRLPPRIHVRRVEHRHSRLEANINQLRRRLHVVRAPILETGALPKRGRAEAEHGHLETAAAQKSIFHVYFNSNHHGGSAIVPPSSTSDVPLI